VVRSDRAPIERGDRASVLRKRESAKGNRSVIVALMTIDRRSQAFA
jgi:hypothetical protein